MINLVRVGFSYAHESIETKMRFQIIKEGKGMEPISQPDLLNKIDSCLKSDNAKNENPFLILLNPSCFQEICDYIGWGEETEKNQIEQGGIILGNVYKDPDSELTVGVAKCSVPAIGADASITHFEIGLEAWHKMLAYMDEMNRILIDKEKIYLIGWYHTHPKHLKVYMSNKDLETQKLFFNLDYHFSVILNPQKRYWKAYQGEFGNECDGLVLTNNFKCLK